MKGISAVKFALIYAGCFIGAGFLSGQELWQFFGSFGSIGIVGLVVSVVIQISLIYVVLTLAKSKNTCDFDRLIAPKNAGLSAIFSCLEVLFTFFIVCITCAGAGSLFSSVFNLNKAIGSIIFAAVVLLVALSGLNGVVKLLSFTVPLLVFVTAIISFYALFNYGYPSVIQVANGQNSSLLNNFLISAILFATYNVFCSLGITTPLAVKVNSPLIGSVLAGLILLMAALLVLFPIFSAVQFAKEDLPMLEIAKNLGNTLYYVYAILLMIGIFGAGLTSTVSIQNFVTKKLGVKKWAITVLVCGAAALISFIGFSRLIGVLYPLCGYVGVIATALIVKNYILSKSKGG